MQLRRDFCLGGLLGLPRFSSGWRPTLAEGLALLAERGYRGVIAWDSFAEIQAAGLVPCGMARVLRPKDAFEVAVRHRDAGLDFTTLHAGTGFESDAEMDSLAGAILEAAAATAYTLHVETHRATMTQDIQRTLDLVKRFPELPLTLDFSHWYTGHEMTYGGEFLDRVAKLGPVFDCVRSMQIRVGDAGRIQTAWNLEAAHANDHAIALQNCLGRLSRLPNPPAVLSVAPELLPAKLNDGSNARWICYADEVEQSDRFADAIALSDFSESIFSALAGNGERAAHG